MITTTGQTNNGKTAPLIAYKYVWLAHAIIIFFLNLCIRRKFDQK